jgi:regulator of sigma E protease
MAVIIFFAVLFVLILVHEWGHFIVAKKTGMRVDEFGIGFPPKLYGIKKGETEYTFNALPIGGFVRIWGENGEENLPAVDREGSSQPILTDNEPSTDTSRAFSHRPKWAQALVLIAGVTMNIIFAWFLFTVTGLIGISTPVDETNASPSAELYVVSVIPNSPAAVIPVGSVITSISTPNGTTETLTPSKFTTAVQQAGTAPVTIWYRVKGENRSTTLTPTPGLIDSDPSRVAVGASLSMVEMEQLGFLEAIKYGFGATWHGIVSICVGLWSLLSQTFVGEADFSQVAGPVGIVGMVGDAAAYGITALLTFTAIISLNLAVINLLPFPALDGGRLVFVAIEAATRKRIPPEWTGRVNMVGFALLMLLMVAVTYNDIIRLL